MKFASLLLGGSLLTGAVGSVPATPVLETRASGVRVAIVDATGRLTGVLQATSSGRPDPSGSTIMVNLVVEHAAGMTECVASGDRAAAGMRVIEGLVTGWCQDLVTDERVPIAALIHTRFTPRAQPTERSDGYRERGRRCEVTRTRAPAEATGRVLVSIEALGVRAPLSPDGLATLTGSHERCALRAG